MQPSEDQEMILASLRCHGQILDLTPTKLTQSNHVLRSLIALYKEGRFARLVVDEAHCISQWGNEFRQAYGLTGWVRNQYFQSVSIMACTATATVITKSAIAYSLELRAGYKLHETSSNRPNLKYHALLKEGLGLRKGRQIAELVNAKHKDEFGIVYCSTRKRTKELAEGLREFDIKTGHCSSDEKHNIAEILDKWHAGEVCVIVATIAFGMSVFCKFCEKTCKSEKGMRMHVKQKHGDDVDMA